MHSIRARLSAVIFAMAAVSLGAVALSLMVFSGVGDVFAGLRKDRMPEVEASMNLIAASGGMTAEVARMQRAAAAPEVNGARAALDARVGAARSAVAVLPAQTRAALDGALDTVERSSIRLGAARQTEIDASARVAERLTALFALSDEAAIALAALEAGASSRLLDGGRTAVDAVTGALDTLIQRDVAAARLLLEIRGEVNLIAGFAVARSLSLDAGFRAILDDVSTASRARLGALLPSIPADVMPEADRDALAELLALSAGSNASARATERLRDQMLRVRQRADVALATALDDVLFNLEIGAADTADANAVAVRDLLDGEVAQMRGVLKLTAEIGAFVSAALRVAYAPDMAVLDSAALALTRANTRLAEAAPAGGASFAALAARFAAIADPTAGIAGRCAEALAAGREALIATRDAEAQAADIAKRAEANAKTAMQRISAAGDDVSGRISGAGMMLLALAAVAVAVGTLALVFARRGIGAPLRALTETTERLSGGDMAPIVGFADRKDEIGRMGAALAVFRNGALKVEELRAGNEAATHAAEARRRAMFALLATEIGDVVSAASQGDFRRRVAATFEDREIGALAEDVNRLLETTETGLTAAGGSLRAMANADLTCRMDGKFAGAFAELQADVNASSARLSELIGGIREVVGVTSTQASELAEGAQQLAARTEGQAATLEETAAAMEQMAATINANVEALNRAEALSDAVLQKTVSGGDAADAAVQNVQRIERSSSRITEIIAVIESIAFQTNLLALNAAVEAARAGDAGKGFAVVAAEVRTLAQRSTEATRSITELIQESAASVAAGVASVQATGAALKEIDVSVQPLIKALSEIAAAGREQSQGVSEVNQSVSDLDHATQQNAHFAERSTNAAGGLASELATLERMVAEFTVLPAQKSVRPASRAA